MPSRCCPTWLPEAGAQPAIRPRHWSRVRRRGLRPGRTAAGRRHGRRRDAVARRRRVAGCPRSAADLVARASRRPALRAVRGIGPVAPRSAVEQTSRAVVMDGVEDARRPRRRVPGCPRSAGRAGCPTGRPACDPSAAIGPVAPLVPVEQQPPVVMDGGEHAVATAHRACGFPRSAGRSGCADLDAQPAPPSAALAPSRRRSRSEQPSAVVMDGVEPMHRFGRRQSSQAP